jgi:hypothetical protein
MSWMATVRVVRLNGMGRSEERRTPSPATTRVVATNETRRHGEPPAASGPTTPLVPAHDARRRSQRPPSLLRTTPVVAPNDSHRCSERRSSCLQPSRGSARGPRWPKEFHHLRDAKAPLVSPTCPPQRPSGWTTRTAADVTGRRSHPRCRSASDAIRSTGEEKAPSSPDARDTSARRMRPRGSRGPARPRWPCPPAARWRGAAGWGARAA